MSIKDFVEKIKPFYKLLLILVVAFLFFILGRLSVLEEMKEPLKIIYPREENSASVLNAINGSSDTNTISTLNTGGEVIGSKTGKKYYYPWCGSLKRVKEENRITFASIEEAKSAGYTPAGNCAGLK